MNEKKGKNKKIGNKTLLNESTRKVELVAKKETGVVTLVFNAKKSGGAILPLRLKYSERISLLRDVFEVFNIHFKPIFITDAFGSAV